MSHKHLITVSILTSLLLAVTAYGDSSASRRDADNESRRSQPAAPVIHRGATVPAGWFKKPKPPAVLSGNQVQAARQAAHYDTDGADDREKSKQAKSGVSQRLQQMRRAVVYDDLPAGSPPTRRIDKARAPRAVTSPSGTVSSSKAPQGPPAETHDGAPSKTTLDPLPLIVDQLPSIMKRPDAAEEPRETETDQPVIAEPRMRLESTPPPATTGLTEVQPVVEPVTTAPKMELQPTPQPVTASPIVERPSPIAEQAAPTQTPDTAAPEGVLITHQSPVLSVTTRGPRTIVVGKASTYVVDVANRSEVDARDVIVRMNVPHWVEVVKHNATSGSAHIQPDDQGNASLTWTVGRLHAQGQEKLTLDLIPRGSRPLDLGVTWSFSPATSTAQIQVQEPKLAMTVTGSQDVMYGETKVFTISISNPGTGDAENVVLNLLPLVPGEGSAGVRQLGTIPSGARRTVEVELTARQTGRLQVRAEATADGGLHCKAQQDVLVRRAVLEVQIEGPPMKYAGTRSRYTIRVINNGDAGAQEVVALATLPAGAQQVACSEGATVDTNHGQVQWQLGTLRPGASRVLELECVLMSAGANRLDLRTVAAGDLSAVGSAVTQIESLADLKLMVNDPKGAVAVGAEVTYEVRIVNRGTKAAENILLLGYFSEGIEPVAVRGWRGSINEGEVVLEKITRLGAGQEMVVKIAAQANRPGDHVFRTELECSDPETKLAVEEWTRFYGEVEVQAARPVTSQPADVPKVEDQTPAE